MVYHYVFLYLSGWTEIFDGCVTFLPTVYYCQLVGMMDGTDIHLVSYLLPVHKIRFHLIVVSSVVFKQNLDRNSPRFHCAAQSSSPFSIRFKNVEYPLTG